MLRAGPFGKRRPVYTPTVTGHKAPTGGAGQEALRREIIASGRRRLRRRSPIAGGSEPFQGSEIIASGRRRLRRRSPIAGGSEPFQGSEIIGQRRGGCPSVRSSRSG